MNEEAAQTIVGYAKALFPFTTDAQLALVRDLCRPFPDPKYVSDTLQRLATEDARLQIPALRLSIDNELRRRGKTTYDQRRWSERKTDGQLAARAKDVEAMIADLSEEDMAELKPRALQGAVDRGVLTEAGVAFLAKRDGRKNPTLRALIYDLMTGRTVAP